MSDIELYYDIVCPYAYMAAAKIERLSQQQTYNVRWVPILLGGIYRHWNAPDIPSQTWPKSKRAYAALDLKRQADLAGVKLRYHPRHPLRTVKAMRFLCAVPKDKLPSVSLRLFQAYWDENQHIDTDDVLNQIAVELKLPIDLFLSNQAKEQLYKNTQEAFDRGVFGVPSIFVGQKMWWGQDRMLFVEKELGSPERTWPAAQKTGRTVEFFHDFSSPFSYLGAMQIQSIADRYGFHLHWRPILLGALFRNIGTPDVPLFSMSKGKQKYLLQDLYDWSQWWNVPFRFPDIFPVRTILPLRLAIIDPSLNEIFYRAMWVDNRNIGSEDVVRDLLKENGKDAEMLFHKIPQAKQQLIDNTTRAQQLGICGVPSIYNGQEIWWGQDRMYDFAQALCKTKTV
ncbi:MAG: 2-hydroxychromene-2-carboxylate isomerase [Myxococcota bacterium]|nr:2-hydroxychromene-2-carboxylate isomerase [Myxococcota bacterium]